MQCVRERAQSTRYIYHLKKVEVRVPNGFQCIKKRELVKFSVNCNDRSISKICDFTRPRCHSLSWCELKALYDRNTGVKDLFIDAIMEIHCYILSLSCQENWKCLEERSGMRVMFAEFEAKDGPPEVMVSFLRLEKAFTNEDTPMFAMNVY